MADDDMRIVPERDEVRSRARPSAPRANSSSSKPSRPAPAVAAKKSSGSSSIVTIILGLFVALLAGSCAFLYLQTAELATQRDALSERVADIESKLSVTDESLSQSGAALQSVLKEHSVDLELHMAEIRKLWAVAYDRNRVSIEELQASQKNMTTRMDSLASATSKLDPIVKGYSGIESRLETISSQLLAQSATVDDILSTNRNHTDKLNNLSSGVTSQSAITAELQDAIDAIDQYRLQINQRLLRIETVQ